MNLILWIIFGGLAGWLASIVVGAEEGFGLLGNIVVGILGAFIGGWVSEKVGMGGEPGADRPTSLISFFWAVIGAVVLLLLLSLFF